MTKTAEILLATLGCVLFILFWLYFAFFLFLEYGGGGH